MNNRPSTTYTGDNFRHLVADSYRTLGAIRVQEEINLGGHAVDVLAELPIPAYGIASIAVECKSTLEEDGASVKKDKAVKWANEVADLRRGQLVDLAVMVARVGFSRPAREVLNANRIVAITLDEILINAFPFREYVQRFIAEYDRSPLTAPTEYLFRPLTVRNLNRSYFARSGRVEGRRTTQNFRDLDDLLLGSIQQKVKARANDGWLTGNAPSLIGRNLLLLGEFGMGKTSFLLHLMRDLCERWLVDQTMPIPIFISLGEFNYETPIGLLKQALGQYGILISNPDTLTRFLSMGRFTLLLDGADELVTRGDFSQVRRILQDLSILSTGGSRLIVSCRSHWFRDEEELARVINDNRVENIINSGPIDERKYSLLILNKLNWNQIWRFLEENNPTQLQELLALFGHHEELVELAGIPVFLLMLTKIVDRLGGVNRISMADIFRLYADTWLRAEDRPSNLLSPEKKEFFLEAFARRTRELPEQSLHYSQLRQVLREVLSEHQADIQADRLDWFEQDIRTSSLLTRDAQGNYSFVHRSFGEYFYARWCYRILSGSPSASDLKDSVGRDLIGQAFLFVSSAYWSLLRDIIDEATLIGRLEDCRGKTLEEVGFSATNLVTLASGKLRKRIALNDLPLSSLFCVGDWGETDFRRSNLSDAIFFDARLDSALFDETSCVGAKFHGSWMTDASFDNSDLTDARVDPGITLTQLCLTESGFIAGGGDGSLQIFEDEHDPIRVEGHADLVNEVSVSKRFVATGGYSDRTAIIRSLDARQTVIKEWHEFDANIVAVQFNEDGSRLLIAELYGRILVAEIPSMRTVIDLKIPHPIDSQLHAARWLGRNVLVVLDEQLHLLDGSTGESIWKRPLGFDVYTMEANGEIIA